MAVDRAARDRVAGALAGWMRGEIDNLQLDEVLQAVETEDRAVNQVILGAWFLYDDFKSHPIGVTAEGWEALRRTLAFLSSDYDLVEHRGRRRRPGGREVLAGTSLALLAAGMAWTWADRWWPQVALWLLCGAGWAAWLLWSPHDDDEDGDAADRSPWYPFDTRKQWESVAARAEAWDLPPYDLARHGARRPLRGRAAEAAMNVWGFAFLAVVTPLSLPLLMIPRRQTLTVVTGEPGTWTAPPPASLPPASASPSSP